jgi:hypothetical protein
MTVIQRPPCAHPVSLMALGVTLLLLLLAAVAQHQIQVQGSGYSIEFYEKACERQKHFMLDTWLVEHAWMNPSIIRDPETPEKIVMVWR